MTGQIDFVRAALKWQYNWIGMAGAAAFAVVSASGLPLILAAGLELIYLSLVPNSSRFQRLVRSWKFEEEKREHEMKLSACSTNCLRKCGPVTPTWPKSARPFARTTPGCRPRRRYSSSRWGQAARAAARLRPPAARRAPAAGVPAGHQSRRTSSARCEQLKKDLSKDAPKVQEINRKRDRDPDQAAGEVREDSAKTAK